MYLILSIIMGILLSGAYLKYFITPYIWIFSSWFIIFLLIGILNKHSSMKTICFSLCGFFLIFGIFEFYQWADSIKRCEYYSRWRDDHLHLDNRHELGYLPKKNSSWTASRYFDNEIVYKCTYTINKNGYRISPPHKEKVKGCLLFFGCSFTYGEGVNDTETLPYVTGILLEENYAVHNFGIHGTGTHQMLFAIEHGIVENIVKYNVTHVIYQTIYPEHVHRLLGIQPWSKRDPYYILGEHEEVIYKGHFDDNSASHTSIQKILNKLNIQLNKSYLFLRIKKKMRYRISNNNVRLFIRMIEKSKNIIATRYPGVEFHIIWWGYEDKSVLEELAEKGIRVHLIRNILPITYNYEGNEISEVKWFKRFKYLIPLDRHPKPLTYRIIAEYVKQNIIERPNP